MKKILVLFLMLGLCMSVFSKEFTEAFNNADYTKCQEILDSTKPSEKDNDWKKFSWCDRSLILTVKLNKITKNNFKQEIDNYMKTYKFEKTYYLAFLISTCWNSGEDHELKISALNEGKRFIEVNYNDVKKSVNCGVIYRELKEYNKAIESFKISRNLQKNKNFTTWLLYHLTCISGVEFFTDAQKIEALSYVKETPGSIETPNKLNILCENIKTKFFDPKYDEVVKPLLFVLNRRLYSNISKSEDWKKAIVNLHLLMKSYNL